MRRIAMATWFGLVMSIAGCQKAQKDVEPEQSAELNFGSLQPDLYATDAPPAAVDAPSVAETPPAPAASEEASYGQPATVETTLLSGSTHIVVKGDTLYRLARKYYNDQSRWKDIYEANRDTLRDPNKLRIGQELMIP